MGIDDIKFRGGANPRQGLTVEGEADPGADVVVENLSAAPWGPSDEQSSFTRVKAGPDGRFSAKVVGGAEGDWLRLQAGPARGASALTVRIEGTAAVDGRQPELSQQSLRLVDAGSAPSGERLYQLGNVSRNQRLGEPHLDLVLENERTRQEVEVMLDDRGRLPSGIELTGQPGDSFTLTPDDGQHPGSGEVWGRVTVPPEDGQPLFSIARGAKLAELSGPLFRDGPGADDPLQGSGIGDCYLVAAVSTIADLRPDVLEDIMKEGPDGKVTVTFRAWDEDAQRYAAEEVTVSREVPVRRGEVVLGHCRGSARASRNEAWWPLLEKAYAQWKGSYQAISSGYPYEIFEAVLGREGKHFDPPHLEPTALAKVIDKALAEKAPMVAWTFADTQTRPFLGSGLVADHAYSVHGLVEEGGQTFVELRNPWGHREPPGDGKDDGLFRLPLGDFQEHFCGLGVAFANP